MIDAEDYPLFPSFTKSMIKKAQAVETSHDEGVHETEDPFHGYFIRVEDVTSLGDLEIPRQSLWDFLKP